VVFETKDGLITNVPSTVYSRVSISGLMDQYFGIYLAELLVSAWKNQNIRSWLVRVISESKAVQV
jgi:hypothetical protein